MHVTTLDLAVPHFGYYSLINVEGISPVTVPIPIGAGTIVLRCFLLFSYICHTHRNWTLFEKYLRG